MGIQAVFPLFAWMFLMTANVWAQASVGPAPQKVRYPTSAGERIPDFADTPIRFPLPSVAAIARATDGAVWTGSSHGVDRWDPLTQRIDHFASKRYLPDDAVTGLVPGPSGSMWVKTAGGVVRLGLEAIPLTRKAREFEERVRRRHDRYGMVADSRLRTPGDPSTNVLTSSDNDGLWTAMYAASLCYRYAVEKSPEVLQLAKKHIEAVLFLEQITGMPGFPARSYIKTGDPKPGDGTWYPTADGQYIWKADTSSDEIVGHFYLFGIAHDLLPDAALKKRIVETARRIMDHILDNKLYLIDKTGKPTTWGRWSEEYFASPTGYPDSPLNALEILAFLKTTHHLTGDAKYEREYRRLALGRGYLDIAQKVLERREEINYSDEELAMLPFYLVFRYEKDAALRAGYERALDQWWQNIQREHNPLWTFIYRRAKPVTPAAMDKSIETLYRIPNDLISWTVVNSKRGDIDFEPESDRFRRRQIRQFLPPDERPVMKWNGNPFIPDGGNGGRSEDDGGFFLLPYWMGRYYGHVTPRM